MLRGAHEPGAGIVRHSRLGPFLERDDERVLREILREADVADNAREAGNQLCRLDPPNRVDGAMGFRRCHGKQSHQARVAVQVDGNCHPT